MATSLRPKGSTCFAPIPLPVDKDLEDPDYAEESSDESSESDSWSDSDSDSDSPAQILRSFHANKKPSTLRGVYKKDSRTTKWRQQKKNEEHKQHLKRLKIPQISTFFAPKKRARSISPHPDEISNESADAFVDDLVEMVEKLTLGPDGLISVVLDSSDSEDSDPDSEDSNAESEMDHDECQDNMVPADITVAEAQEWIEGNEDEQDKVDVIKLITRSLQQLKKLRT